VDEVVTLEKQRFASDLGEGIGKTVTKVQTGRVPTALAEVAIGRAGDAGLL